MRKILIIGLIALLSGCASSGVKVSPEKLSKFTKGETTYSEVVSTLGKPSQSVITSNGGRTVMYTYFSTQARPEMFIPVVGAFVGGMDMENSTVIINFTEDGILKDYTETSGSSGTGTGLEAYSQNRTAVKGGE